jgi:hypothetical protein
MTLNILKYSGKPPKNTMMMGFKSNWNKAIKIYKTKQVFPTLHGPKVEQFYWNLFKPSKDHVTIDTFMLACYYETDSYGVKKYAREKYIETLKEEVRALAHKYSIQPLQMQATIWITYHRMVKSMASYSGQLNLKIF